jgi:hypothetical protein
LTSSRLMALATTILVIGAMSQSTAGAQDSPRLVIMSPRDGAVLPMQQQLLIEARFEPAVDFGTTAVEARVEAARGSDRIVIAEGDIRSFESPEQLRALWNVEDVAPGPYVITVTATAGDRTGTATTKVTLHPPPTVLVRVTSIRSRKRGINVTFAATASSATSTAIKEFIWTPGDGGGPRRTTRGTFSHTYPKGNATYIVWLEVNDALGGSTLIARDLNLPGSLPQRRQGYDVHPTRGGQDSDLLQETNDCGCEDMTVLVPIINPPPRSSVYCAAAVPAQPGCAQVGNPPPPDNCPGNQVPYKCPLGRIAPAAGQRQLGWGFEVVAKLSARTNNTKSCTQGQYARGSWTKDGKPKPNPPAKGAPPAGQVTLPDGAAGAPGFTFTGVGAPNPFPPFGGPNYGGDRYTNPSDYKRHKPLGFRWLDMPQVPVGANATTDDREYIVFVLGNLGTCWCRFSIRQTWTAAGGVGGPGLALIDSHNCRLFNPTQ